MNDGVKTTREISSEAQTGIERPRLHSSALLNGHKIIEIEHHGEIYRLQLTRQGKLILTK